MATSQDLTPAHLPSRDSSQTGVAGQISLKTPDLDPKLTPKSASGQQSPYAVTPSQIPAETATPGPNLPLRSALSWELSQAPQQNQDQPSTRPVNLVDESAPALTGNASPDRITASASPAAAPSGQPLPVVAVAIAPSPAVGGKSPGSGSSRTARGAGKVNLAEHDVSSVEGQPSGPVVDAFAMARDGAGLRGSVRGTGEPAETSTVSAAASSEPRETFAALDAGDAAAKPTWIHAGMQRAEAGFEDPALGWVGVRADSSGGGVHAQLVPGSADAAQALSGHMAGLNAYLAEHHTPVETLTMAAPESGWAGQDSGTGGGQEMQQGAGQETAQRADPGSPSSPAGNVQLQPEVVSGLLTFDRGMEGSAEAARPWGTHISVMA